MVKPILVLNVSLLLLSSLEYLYFPMEGDKESVLKNLDELEWVSILEIEKQTIIHCTHHAERRFILGGWIYIHPKTCLMNDHGLGVLPLEFAIGVPLAPDKHLYNGYDESLKFTLVFKGIPASWLSFTLVEKAEEGEGFCIRNIKRNGVGVYY
jgi:hypothetical protein